MQVTSQRSHDKWRDWSTDEIRKYLGKYSSSSAPGKCSSHRRKKVAFLQKILRQRERAEALLLAGL